MIQPIKEKKKKTELMNEYRRFYSMGWGSKTNIYKSLLSIGPVKLLKHRLDSVRVNLNVKKSYEFEYFYSKQ